MANKYSTLNDLFTAIAQAIRQKTGQNAKIVADNFPSAIAALVQGITPTGTITLTENNVTTDVSKYAYAQVAVPVNSGASGSTGGLTMKTGTITLDATAENLVIDTGLSDVSMILITHDTPSASTTYGWSYSWDAIYGLCLFRSQAQYMSYNYGTRTTRDNYITKDGGTVTANQHASTYPVATGTFTWTAYGTQ